MNFQKSIIDTIKQRSSRRNYINKSLDDKIKFKLIKSFDDCTTGPFGSKIRFKFIDKINLKENEKIGTYGMITGASYFIAGAVEKSDRNLEDFGYAMEKLILIATELGVGTCWLGGSLNRSEFANLIELNDNEMIPAVTPIGYIENEKKVKEKIVEWLMKTKKRKPWEKLFFNEKYGVPIIKNEINKYEKPLEMTRLSPSASNRQPWRIIKEKNIFHFYLERSKVYQVILKRLGVDLQRVDIGIAMSHFELTCNELKLKGEWKLCKVDHINIPENVEYIISWMDLKD